MKVNNKPGWGSLRAERGREDRAEHERCCTCRLTSGPGLTFSSQSPWFTTQDLVPCILRYIPKTWRMEGMKMSFISHIDDLQVFKEVLLDIRESCPWQMTLLLYLISSSHQGVPNKICYVLNCHIISAPFLHSTTRPANIYIMPKSLNHTF